MGRLWQKSESWWTFYHNYDWLKCFHFCTTFYDHVCSYLYSLICHKQEITGLQGTFVSLICGATGSEVLIMQVWFSAAMWKWASTLPAISYQPVKIKISYIVSLFCAPLIGAAPLLDNSHYTEVTDHRTQVTNKMRHSLEPCNNLS